jgi:NADH dehydrogenase/NADH:ubiquinone oxidoreductase subunit G
MLMHKLMINGKPVEAQDGATILDAARRAGIRIPTLCFLEKREPIGACRVCLVEVTGARTLMTACSTPVANGMEIKTNSPRVRAARRQVVELLLSEHDGNCQICDRNQDCELQALASELGIREIEFEGEN